MIEDIHKWTAYPHEDYASTINDIQAKGARFDAWRNFFQPAILEILHGSGSEIYVRDFNLSDGRVDFSKDITEAEAREAIAFLFRSTAPVEEYAFQRTRLTDPRAFVRFPLSHFVEVDQRVVGYFGNSPKRNRTLCENSSCIPSHKVRMSRRRRE